MATNEVGRVAVKVIPDLDGFVSKVKSELSRIRDFKIPVALDGKGVASSAKQIRSQVEQGPAAVVKAQVSLRESLGRLRAEVQRAAAAAQKGVKVEIPIEVKRDVLRGLLSVMQSGGGGPGKALLGVARGMTAIAAMGGAVQIIAGLGVALAQLSGVALAVPALLFALGAGFAAVKIGLSGVGDALKGDAAALAKLAPSARESVQALREMAPAWDEVKTSVQGSLFKGLANDFKTLGSNYIPILRTGLAGVAAQMNVVARGALAATNTPFFKGAVTTVLQNTAAMFREIGTGVGGFLTGLISIGSVGSQYLAPLGEAINGIAARFSSWAQSLQGQNQIKAWIDQALVAFGQLRTIAANVGSTLQTVFSGLSAGGAAGFLATLVAVTAQVRAFFESVQGQQVLVQLGQIFASAGAAARGVFGAALAALPGILNVVTPILTTIGDTIARYPGLFLAVGTGIAIFGKVLGTIIPIVTFVITHLSTLKTIFSVVRVALLALTGPVGIVIAAVTGLAAAFTYAYQHSETFRNIVQAALSAVVSAAKTAAAGVMAGLNALAALPGRALAWFGGMHRSAVAKFQEVEAFARTVPGKVLSALGNMGSVLLGAGRAIMDGLLNGIKAAWNNVRNYLSGLAAEIKSLKGPIEKDRKLLIDEGKAIMQGLGKGLKTGYREVESLVGGMASQIESAFGEPMLDASVSGSLGKFQPMSMPAPGDWKINEDQTINLVVSDKVLAKVVNKRNHMDSRR